MTLNSNGVKRTILYNVKDCNGKYIPKQGDKVNYFQNSCLARMFLLFFKCILGKI